MQIDMLKGHSDKIFILILNVLLVGQNLIQFRKKSKVFFCFTLENNKAEVTEARQFQLKSLPRVSRCATRELNSKYLKQKIMME